jgi:MFS family permease
MKPLPGGVGGDTFASLRRHRNYRLYFAGQFVSQAGTWLQSAAQAWMVLTLTHSAVDVGLVSFWQFLPYTTLGLFGGAISDRLDHRLALTGTQVALGVCACFLALFAFLHGHNLTIVYAIAAVRGMVQILNNPSRQALMIQMVGRDELANAISLNSGISNATRIVGPGIAGVLIAVTGVGICFTLNAASYAAVVAALLMMRPQEFFPMRHARRDAFLNNLREGFRYAVRAPRVWLPLGMLVVISTLGINFSVLLPLLASQTLHAGSEVYGLITSLFGVGALTGALLSASLGRATWKTLILSGGGFSLFELLLAPQHTLVGVIVFLMATGICYTVYTATTNSMVQLAAPDTLQGRVAGLYSYVFLGSNPPGALIAGGLSQADGTELAFGVAGIAGVLTTLLALGALWAGVGNRAVAVENLERRPPSDASQGDG